MKICTSCKFDLPLEDFNKNKAKPDGYNNMCRDCVSIYAQQSTSNWNTKEYKRKKLQNYRTELRKKLIKTLGNKCECCGEDTFEFLTLEHRNGNGRLHVKQYGRDVWSMYREILKEVNPLEKYGILCYNCNCAKGKYGYCPHEKKVEVIKHVN